LCGIRKEYKKLSLEVKNGAFNTPKAGKKVCTGNSQHPYNSRKLPC
jgi:hypothetical protein